MDPRFPRLKKAVSSRPFLLFLLFVALLIVLTSFYVGLRDEGMAGTDVYWDVAIAIVAVMAIIFFLCAFICPSCMTPAREALEEPVSYHRNPERASIGHDNYGANIQPELPNVESSSQPIIANPFRRFFGSASSSSRNVRSLPAPPGPDDRRTRNPQMGSAPMWDTPPPTYREAVGRAVAMGSELPSQFRSRDLTFSLATTPSESESDPPHLAQSTPLPPDTTDADQDQPNVALAEPSPPSGAENGDQASPETENNLNLNRAASSSPSTHTGSSASIDSSSTWTSVSSLTIVSSEDGPRGPDPNAPRVISSDLPSHTEQSSVNETFLPQEEESVMATHVAGPMPEEEIEQPSHSDVTIEIEDDGDVETEVGLVLQLASSLLGAAWSSVSRWVRPQELPTSVPSEASPGSPLSRERSLASPGSGNEEPSPDDEMASTPTRVNIAESTEPSQQGEDVIPPERRERP